jgi:hypothetical protein
MMRTTVGLIVAAMLLTAMPALANFDIELKIDSQYAPGLKIEKPTNARNFGDRVVSYIRILPPAKGRRPFPAFISTHNYLTCPESDKHTVVNEVREISYERRSGVKVLGFWFDPPGCDSPTFHLEPVFPD